jgi:hypothetical protein
MRVLRTAALDITHHFSLDEAALDAGGAVTYAVTRLDGTAVTSGTAADAAGTGNYSFTLPGGPTSPTSATWQLDTLAVSWTGTFGGAVFTALDYVEVVGGYLFNLDEARALPPALDTTTYPTATLKTKRIEVEEECERICGRAFVPRFHREALSGRDTDRLGVRHRYLRTLRAVTVSGVAWSAPDVAAVRISESGMLTRPAGNIWPAGASNVVVEYEHGYDYPPEEIRSAAMKRLRSRLTTTSSGVPDRAISWNTQDGGTYRISLPSGERTGIPDVDAAYEGYPRRRRAVFA